MVRELGSNIDSRKVGTSITKWDAGRLARVSSQAWVSVLLPHKPWARKVSAMKRHCPQGEAVSHWTGL